MSKDITTEKTCVIIGASHAGVNLAFSLRKEGWEGQIIVYDIDPVLPYHRPPLSKAYLNSEDSIEKNALKSAESYEKERITLRLGIAVEEIDAKGKTVTLNDHSVQPYDKLVLATGASPIIPSINGINEANNLFPLRTAKDVAGIRNAMQESEQKRVVIIGGGYIGLETAASLKKMGASVTVLEREERILARVTSERMSQFFQDLHTENGVAILTNKNVESLQTNEGVNTVTCSDGSTYTADIIIVGVGVRVNLQLADQAELDIENGIKVDETTCTNNKDIYAIGDCTYHHNPHYKRYIRLESVQNAVDQAKVAAANICGKATDYNAIPWFWSDQFNIKLQMVGLAEGYTEALVRKEEGDAVKFSVWYFKNEQLLAVDAVNNAKAYVIGTKFIKEGRIVNKEKLIDSSIAFKPANLLEEMVL